MRISLDVLNIVNLAERHLELVQQGTDPFKKLSLSKLRSNSLSSACICWTR